jgi:hypothetical protein
MAPLSHLRVEHFVPVHFTVLRISVVLRTVYQQQGRELKTNRSEVTLIACCCTHCPRISTRNCMDWAMSRSACPSQHTDRAKSQKDFDKRDDLPRKKKPPSMRCVRRYLARTSVAKARGRQQHLLSNMEDLRPFLRKSTEASSFLTTSIRD